MIIKLFWQTNWNFTLWTLCPNSQQLHWLSSYLTQMLRCLGLYRLLYLINFVLSLTSLPIIPQDPSIYTIQVWSDASDCEDSTLRTVAEGGFRKRENIYSQNIRCSYSGWSSATVTPPILTAAMLAGSRMGTTGALLTRDGREDICQYKIMTGNYSKIFLGFVQQ